MSQSGTLFDHLVVNCLPLCHLVYREVVPDAMTLCTLHNVQVRNIDGYVLPMRTCEVRSCTQNQLTTECFKDSGHPR